MTIDTIQPAPAPAATRIGQATAVEQSRAVAEVAAAVQVAQLCPRDVQAATDEMRRACRHPRLAERAFFRYSRGDGQVTGPSVYLARELARCWGNVQSGISELRRDDEHGQSEMQAWAWDVQTNSRLSTTFIVPHARDTKRGRKDLTDLRDVYENNANNGARRLREMILGLLPQWFVEEAKDLCTETIQQGNGKPLAERVAASVAAFAGEFRIEQARLEKRIGHPSSAWTAHDVATLAVIFASLRRGEIHVEDEFPVEASASVSVDDLAQAPAPAPAAAPGAAGSAPGAAASEPAPLAPVAAAGIDKRQWAAINARFVELAAAVPRAGLTGPGQSERRMHVISTIVGRPIARGSELLAIDAALVLDNLTGDAGITVVTDLLTDASIVREEYGDGAPTHVVDAGPALPGEDDVDPTMDAGWPMDGAEADAEGR